MAKNIDKTMFSGDDKVMPFSAVDNDGSAVTVTGGTATYEIAASKSSASPLVSKTSADSEITLSGTTVTVTLVPADTADLHGNYYHELQVTDSSGAVLTALYGTMFIRKDLI